MNQNNNHTPAQALVHFKTGEKRQGFLYRTGKRLFTLIDFENPLLAITNGNGITFSADEIYSISTDLK